MLAVLIVAAVLVVLSPLAAIPLLRRASTQTEEDDFAGVPQRAVFTQEPR